MEIYPENQPIHVHKYSDPGSVVKVVVVIVVSVTVVVVEGIVFAKNVVQKSKGTRQRPGPSE